MSYATPFTLLSFHLPDHDDSVAERLSWPLAGSVLLHVVVFVALLSLRFASSLEQSSGSYEVTLVTLPEIAASPTAQPAKESRLKKKVDKVIPPSKAVRTNRSRSPVNPRVPNRAMDSLVSEPKSQVPAISPKVVAPVAPDHRPTLKQNMDKLLPPPPADVREVPKPELVTDSLMSALDSVVVPKPQPQALPQKSAQVRPPAPAPVKRAPAVEKDVPAFKAPPEAPTLVVGKSKTPTPTPTPTPKPDMLTPTLKKAVGSTTVVPKKLEQVSQRVNPAVASERKQKQNAPKAPESPAITLPRAFRPAAVAPSEMPKKETPRQTARKSRTEESFQEAIQSVQIPESNPKKNTSPPVNQAAPFVSEPIPQAPPLSEFQDLVRSQSTVAETTSEPDTPLKQEIDVSLPVLLSFDTQPVSKQTESGTEDRRGLRRAGFCSPQNRYWKNVNKIIDGIHDNKYWYKQSVESPPVLTFRVERNGQVKDLDILRKSGNKKFDSFAKGAVAAADPLPPFPTNTSKPFCQVQLTFRSPNR